MVKSIILAIALLATFHMSYGMKILNLFPFPVKSHNNIGEGVNRHLLNAGHEVTYVTAFLTKNPHPKLRQINVTTNLNMIPKDSISIKNYKGPSSNKLAHLTMMIGFHMMNKMTIQNENLQKLLHDPNEEFDVVIADWNLNDITYSGIAKIYNAPLIWVSTLEPHWMIVKMIDEAFHPAYTSDIMAPKTPPFTFWERAMELWTQLKVTFYTEMIFHYFDSYLYSNEIAPIIKSRGMEPPAAQDLKYNASLVISNSHVSFGEAHRLPANYISVGGFHIEEDVKPLSGDLKDIMDNAQHGVIYFSMGSIIQSTDLSEEVTQALLKMFGTLQQTVIWKFETDRTDLPKNVHILKWAPQQSILAHPKCSLFITHGGLLSTTEAIHHAVPIIGIPVFVDQFSNIDRAVSKGFAKRVDLVMSATLADNLKVAIEEVLSDPKYKEKVEQLSFIFHHRPVKPGTELVHWVEHVVKTRGALHLRSPALLVPRYQKIYLDLLLLIVLFIIAVRFLYNNVLRNILFKRTNNKIKVN